VLATDAPDIGHVAPISTDRQPALPGNLTLLFGAHGGKTPAALLRARLLGLATPCPPGSRSALLTSAGLSPTPVAGTPLTASAARLLLFHLSHAPAAAAGLRSTAGGALAIGFFGADGLSIAIVLSLIDCTGGPVP
jgi:hypothetical protein